jgi:hypothetical protein
VRYKFAFEWLESQGEPWWLTNPPMDISNIPYAVDEVNPQKGDITLSDMILEDTQPVYIPFVDPDEDIKPTIISPTT